MIVGSQEWSEVQPIDWRQIISLLHSLSLCLYFCLSLSHVCCLPLSNSFDVMESPEKRSLPCWTTGCKLSLRYTDAEDNLIYKHSTVNGAVQHQQYPANNNCNSVQHSIWVLWHTKCYFHFTKTLYQYHTEKLQNYQKAITQDTIMVWKMIQTK